MDWFNALLNKANPQDFVAMAGFGIIYWMVTTKRQIARQTVELAIKLIAGVVLVTVIGRVSMAFIATLH